MPIITPAYPCMNSSYNVSASTLRIMTDEFRRGKEICEAMDANKADWDTLFEPFAFFAAYKNYLQIDIFSGNTDDLRKWKGWVESRLRQLTLKIERHTYDMLQCHPHPHDFQDTSQPLHCSYFMGLQRKQRVPANESKPFDIRRTVEEFKHAVNGYKLWSPGMEISVTHVRRKNIPNFVFPGGVRPSPNSKGTWDSRRRLEHRISSANAATEVSFERKAGSSSPSDGTKRKRTGDGSRDDQLRNSKHPAAAMPVEVCEGGSSYQSVGSITSSRVKDSVLNVKEQKVNDEVISDSATVPPKNPTKAAGTSNGLSYSSGAVEELEVPKLITKPQDLTYSASVQRRKLIIRLNFTSLSKATGKAVDKMFPDGNLSGNIVESENWIKGSSGLYREVHCSMG